MLRFWESKFPQVKPLKRGGGRRYYRREDVELLRRIRQCLHQQGYTIRGVQQLLRDGTLPRDEPGHRPFGTEPGFALLPPGASPAPTPEMPADPLPTPQALRAALEDVRRELLAIRGLLDELRANNASEPV